MALWGTHVAIGGLGALLLVWVFRPDMRYAWVVIGLSGLWAIVPDAHWVYPPLRAVTKPVIHDSVVSNVFWFHGWVDGSVLDAYDSRSRPWLSVPMILVLVVGYGLFRRLRDRHDGRREQAVDP